MAERVIDRASWPRDPAFRLFRGYARPHHVLVTRLDVTRLVTELKPQGVSPFRGCLYAFGAGLHAVPELRQRFRGETVVEHDRLTLSPTISLKDGAFGFGYIPFDPDWPAFDAAARTEIEAVRAGAGRKPVTGEADDFAFLSCLPWLDFTGLTNALPHADDCIPRISWGRFVEDGQRITCAAAIEVHHAMADGAHVAAFFAASQAALDALGLP